MKKYLIVFFAGNCFSQYVSGFSGAWYNPNGIINIINPLEKKYKIIVIPQKKNVKLTSPYISGAKSRSTSWKILCSALREHSCRVIS